VPWLLRIPLRLLLQLVIVQYLLWIVVIDRPWPDLVPSVPTLLLPLVICSHWITLFIWLRLLYLFYTGWLYGLCVLVILVPVTTWIYYCFIGHLLWIVDYLLYSWLCIGLCITLYWLWFLLYYPVSLVYWLAQLFIGLFIDCIIVLWLVVIVVGWFITSCVPACVACCCNCDGHVDYCIVLYCCLIAYCIICCYGLWLCYLFVYLFIWIIVYCVYYVDCIVDPSYPLDCSYCNPTTVIGLFITLLCCYLIGLVGFYLQLFIWLFVIYLILDCYLLLFYCYLLWIDCGPLYYWLLDYWIVFIILLLTIVLYLSHCLVISWLLFILVVIGLQDCVPHITLCIGSCVLLSLVPSQFNPLDYLQCYYLITDPIQFFPLSIGITLLVVLFLYPRIVDCWIVTLYLLIVYSIGWPLYIYFICI